jgi:hypothetical protein
LCAASSSTGTVHLFCLDPALRGALQADDGDEAAGDGGLIASGVNMLAAVLPDMSDSTSRSIATVSELQEELKASNTITYELLVLSAR